ncbi:putative WRKY transcription factor 53 [Primulina tabacum]|uniref:putative WRKY transcription factor 53 n=1 Tax=Primulina tabacum TaxID=48773 RepID=UPI003F5A8851
MESPVNWEYNTLINELTQGMEKAKQLRFHLCTTFQNQPQDLLMQRILSSYEKALLILKWTGSKQKDNVVMAAATSVALESSVSVDGSPRSEGLNKNFGDHQDYVNPSKKRKLQPTWTEQVKVNSESGLEGPTDDGFSWRKYGQKDILGAKYPRSYYRCTYRLVQDCWATKLVQRSDDDPTTFDITYRGTHTCNHSTIAVPPAASPEKQEMKHDISHCSHQPQQLNQTLSSLKSNLRVNTEDLNNNETSAHFSFPSTFASYDSENCYFPLSDLVNGNHQGTYLRTYSPLFLSPAVSESNYFTTGTYNPIKSNRGGANLQHSKADIAEIMSTHASTTNSPIGGVEFSIDHVDLDPNFPFNTTEFFTNSNFEC